MRGRSQLPHPGRADQPLGHPDHRGPWKCSSEIQGSFGYKFCLPVTSDTISTELIRLALISLRNLLPMAGIFNRKGHLQTQNWAHFP